MPARRSATVLLLTALLTACGSGSGGSGTSTPPSGAPTPPAPAPSVPTTPSPAATLPTVKWSDPATWGGALPAAGQQVTLPAGKRVLLDTTPPDLGGLTIPAGSVLEFDDNADRTLRAEWLMVHGELRAGSEAKPFTHHAEILLTNAVPGEDVMGMGDRVLGVMDGTLELHGQPRVAWTRLNATARRGSSTLALERAPDWQAGDSLTLTSTDFGANQTERVTVQRVSGSAVTLAAPLKYTHWGEPISVAGLGVNERAEVGLLTRNVRVAATDDATQTRVGAHVMIMGTSQARIEGAEFTRVGQLNTLRRYPVHFHQLGSAPTSYLRGSSVHESYNRCVVVHGTRDLRVQDNVTFDNIGHCLFLEDGDETGNTLSGNLVTRVRAPDAKQGQTPLLDSDKRPAGYWITHPTNTVKNNVAAGVDGTGFWLAFPEHPTGLAAARTDLWPRRTPLGDFSGNTAHSTDRGLNLDNGPKADGTTEVTSYAPVTTPSDPKSAPVTAILSDFTAYKNRDHGVWLRGKGHVLLNATLADNGVGATFASDASTLKGGVLIGETPNLGQPEGWEPTGTGGRALPRPWDPGFPIRGYQFYDGRVTIDGAALAGFTPDATRQASGLGYLTKNAFSLVPTNNALNLRWADGSARVYFPAAQPGRDGDQAATFLDTDGTVTGTAGTTVTASPLLKGAPDCTPTPAWNASTCPGAYTRLWLQDVAGGQLAPVTVTGPHGTVSLTGTPSSFTSFSTSARLNQTYTLTPSAASPHLRLGLQNRQPGDTLTVTLPAATEPRIYRDWWIDNRNLLKKVTPAALPGTTGDSYTYENGQLTLKLVVQTGRDYAQVEICTTDLCK